ncbi:MAG: histidinol-phosphate transaminase [Actinomycetaceae bacterium]|nr:histidinol-phosphate transaminase [Actinomycetaceae bacterium]
MAKELQVPIRAEVEALPRYIPGRTQPGAIKMSSNESVTPPSSMVVEAAVKATATAHRYPDLTCAPLREALARRYGVEDSQICVGAGSSSILVATLLALCEPGAEVIFPWRSFESYPIAVPATHGIPVPIPIHEDGAHNISGMLDAITPRTAAMIVCSPNNPTGAALPLAEVRRIANEIPPHILLIVDEAYGEFVTDENVSTAIPLIADHPNILVMRTFSKAYALAGLRVGYCVAHPDIAAAVQAVSIPFAVSAPAIAAAIAALGDEEALNERIAGVVAERTRVYEEACKRGIPAAPSQANFLWFPGAGEAFVAACREAGVIVRPFPEGVRVTIGDREEDDRFLEALSALVK